MILILKGGGHGKFHIAFFVPMFSLDKAKTKNNILKSIEVVNKLSKYAKNRIFMVFLFCGIASQVEHAREHNRFHTENKFRDTD